MRPGEIHLANFPFGDVAGMKLRPVRLPTAGLGLVPEVLFVYISSVIPAELLPSDLILDPARPEFEASNLKVISTLRLHKLATIHCSSVMRRLGRIDAAQQALVAARLRDRYLADKYAARSNGPESVASLMARIILYNAGCLMGVA